MGYRILRGFRFRFFGLLRGLGGLYRGFVRVGGRLVLGVLRGVCRIRHIRGRSVAGFTRLHIGGLILMRHAARAAIEATDRTITVFWGEAVVDIGHGVFPVQMEQSRLERMAGHGYAQRILFWGDAHNFRLTHAIDYG